MKHFVQQILNKLPYIRGLVVQIKQLQLQLKNEKKKQGVYPAGHYYSPIPDKDEVIEYIDSKYVKNIDIPDIVLNKALQKNLLVEYSRYYNDLPFPENKTNDCRFYYENSFFSYSDAIFLYSFLRKFKPEKIIEVGSGFSSAVILDTVDRFFKTRPDLTFIEPYPSRLNSLITESDSAEIKILEKKLQEIPLDKFKALQSGDLLFIDSSHVVKCNSDLHYLFSKLMHTLADGVIVHFHDVFYPFDYPSEWLMQGRYWNENYFLRAFLSDNRKWDILFFNNYVGMEFDKYIEGKMPLCRKGAGGSLYIRKVCEVQ
jgi:predicted O-methyltransferase YrrM